MNIRWGKSLYCLFTVFVLNMTVFFLNITGLVQNMTVVNITVFVVNMTVLVVNMTDCAPNGQFQVKFLRIDKADFFFGLFA